MAPTEGHLLHQGSPKMFNTILQKVCHCPSPVLTCQHTWQIENAHADILILTKYRLLYSYGNAMQYKQKGKCQMVRRINTKKGMKGSGKCRTSVTYIYTDMAKFCKTYMRLYITTEKIKKKWQSVVTYGAHRGPYRTHFPDQRRRRVIT